MLQQLLLIMAAYSSLQKKTKNHIKSLKMLYKNKICPNKRRKITMFIFLIKFLLMQWGLRRLDFREDPTLAQFSEWEGVQIFSL